MCGMRIVAIACDDQGNVDMADLPAGTNAVDDPASTEFVVGSALGSLTLCLVHLHVLSTQPGNGFFGLAVGFTL